MLQDVDTTIQAAVGMTMPEAVKAFYGLAEKKSVASLMAVTANQSAKDEVDKTLS